jgi:hypothetical protein
MPDDNVNQLVDLVDQYLILFQKNKDLDNAVSTIIN